MIWNKKILSKKKLQKNVKNSEKYHNKYIHIYIYKNNKYINIEKKGKEKIDLTAQNTNINRNVTKGVEKYDIFPRSNKMQGKEKKEKKKKLQNKKYTSKRKYQKNSIIVHQSLNTIKYYNKSDNSM